ncbi:MAG: 30S ribosomal protein S2 [Patescibacteria group bacterium]
MKTINSQDLMEAGVHYGYSRTRRHPTNSALIYGTKDKVDIINLDKTIPQIEAAANFLQGLGASGKTVLFVGVKPESRNSVIEIANLLKQPYVTERWIGGILTNFAEIKHRIQKLEDLREKRTSGELLKFTKKEQLLIDREMERLTKYFGGLVGVSKLPDAIVIVDQKKEHIAAAEARKSNIPIVAIGNTDCSIRGIDYPITANDSSASSISTILGILKDAYQG